MHQLSSGDKVGNLWHDKSFDRLRNLPAILKCAVFVTVIIRGLRSVDYSRSMQ